MPRTKKTQNTAKPAESKPQERKLKGRGGTNNFGNNTKEWMKTEAQKEIAGQLLQETLTAYKQPKVKSEQELIQRLDDYFTYCANNSVIPTVEEMSLYLGYSVKGIWEIERKNSMALGPNASEIIKKAKAFMQTFDAKFVICGQLNFLTYCFRAKNYYGMVDKKEVEIVPNNPLGELMSQEELERQIAALPDED